MANQQDFNEALLKLAILMYRIDGKIRLNEQELVDEIGDKLDWDGVNSITAVQSQAMADIRQAISSNQVEAYLTTLKPALQFDKQQALDTARQIMQSDGEEAQQERRLYDMLVQML
ncbi:TerB family tellurite resistance protein [Arsukibacterium sp.]|uniref:tellurite resistance TerB family protein n=1 Tax=Arsukibacterium sp. TaxID=1977258 RepID=UPI001BD35B09|nr:TerB family tellurite resistance protein [Arsukibacterium sp.]